MKYALLFLTLGLQFCGSDADISQYETAAEERWEKARKDWTLCKYKKAEKILGKYKTGVLLSEVLSGLKPDKCDDYCRKRELEGENFFRYTCYSRDVNGNDLFFWEAQVNYDSDIIFDIYKGE